MGHRRDYGQILPGKKRGGWRVRWTERGRVRQKTIHGSKSLASRFLAKRQDELAERQVSGERPIHRIKFEDLLAQYEEINAGDKAPTSIYREAKYLRSKALPFFKGLMIDEVRREDIERYLSRRVSADGIATATRNRLLAYLSSFFKKAVALGHARANPAAGIGRKKEALRAVPFLEVEDQARLVELCSFPLRALVGLLLDTGLRLGEVLRLEWRDLDFRRRLLTVRISKTKEPRLVPFTRRGLAALEWARGKRAPDVRVTDLVFPMLVAYTPAGEPALKTPVRRTWYKVRDEADLEGFRLHDCRHVFAVTAVRAGVSLGELRQLLGHATLTMVLRYARHAPADTPERARDRLESFLAGDEKGHARGHGSVA